MWLPAGSDPCGRAAKGKDVSIGPNLAERLDVALRVLEERFEDLAVKRYRSAFTSGRLGPANRQNRFSEVDLRPLNPPGFRIPYTGVRQRQRSHNMR